MKAIEHVNVCVFCGDDADRPITVFETVGPADGKTEVLGRAAFRTGYVQLSGTTVAACEPCLRVLLALSEADSSQRQEWVDHFKTPMAQHLADEVARIAKEDADRAVESARIEEENAATRQRVEEATQIAQAEREAEFDSLDDGEKIKSALRAMLTGTASDAEREKFAGLVEEAKG